jgi:serine/threonine-protein kinase HipA
MMINEFICMKLAELVKLPVAKVSLQRFGEPVLVVKRFDRRCCRLRGGGEIE